MAGRFMDEAGRGALTESVRAVESLSAAEVVIAVRHRSGFYLHADLIAGFAAAYATLWFQLFSPWEFTLVSIQVAPAVAGLGVGFSAHFMPAVQRWLTPARLRRRFVLTAARATFQERGVGLTRGRTGLLVYLSLLEGMAEVVADQGIADAVPTGEWSRAVAAIDEAMARGDDTASVAARIRHLGDLLAPALPRAAEDRNELRDEVGAA